MNVNLKRYLSRAVGDPSNATCTCCGARRVHVQRGEKLVAVACRDCDLLALWTRFA